MALFNSKKKDNSDSAEKASPTKKAKKAELGSVLDESVWSSVHEDLKKNTKLIIKEDGVTKYVALLFDTKEIGGLAGREAKRDESKGSIVEAIKTGRIKTYIRMEMLLDDCFVIIPDEETIANMDEFLLLINAKYTVCTITDDSNLITVADKDDNDLTVTFAQIKDVVVGDGEVGALLKGYVNDLFSGTDVDFDDDNIEDIDDIDSNYTESPEEFDSFNEHVNTPVNAPAQPQAEQQQAAQQQAAQQQAAQQQAAQQQAAQQQAVQQQALLAQQQAVQQRAAMQQQGGMVLPVMQNGQSVSQPVNAQVPHGSLETITGEEVPFGYDDYGEVDDEYEDITEEALRNFVERKFYSDELGLTISTQPFDAQFMHGNSYLPFDTHRGPGFLNEQLTNLSKDANTRMERMHNESLFRLRERYLRLIQNGCTNIAKLLDVSSEDTQFGKMRFMIEARREKSLHDVAQNIQGKQRQLEANWQETLKTVGEQAASAAIADYKQKYGFSHQRDIDMLISREKDEIERDYNNAMKRLNADRRAEATKLLDILINETLSSLSDIYLRCLREECAEQARLQAEINNFLDENRKNEIARIAALEEQNRNQNRAEAVRQEYVSKIKAMAVDFDAKAAAMQAEVNRVRVERENELKLRTTEWEQRLSEERGKSEELQKQIDELLVKYADLDKETKEKYQNQISRLETENDDYRSQLEHVVDTHKRSNKLAIYLTVAALLAAIGIGFMCGSIFNVRRTSKIEQDAISQVQQDVDANNPDAAADN